LSDAQYRQLQRLQHRLEKYVSVFPGTGSGMLHTAAPAPNPGSVDIGLTVDSLKNRFIVTNVVPLSAADAAGIKYGDEIVSVDGKKLYQTTDIFTVMMKINGPAGTDVTLLIGRKTAGYLTIVVHRQDATQTPDFTMETRGGAGYLKVVRFGDMFTARIGNALHNLAVNSASGVVVDFRNTQGGNIDAVGAIVGAFVPTGSVFAQVGNGQSTQKFLTQVASSVPDGVRVVCIINRLTAVPGELAVLALQDYGKINVVGERTANAGTLILPDGSMYSAVTNQLLSPESRFLSGNGVLPEAAVKERNGADLPYQKAIAVLRTPHWSPNMGY
jgi:C-terminal peptidase prc